MDLQANSRIAGIGISIPNQKVSSDDIMTEIGSRRFGVPENFISRRIGILERRFSEPQTRPSDLAFQASAEALQEAGVTPKEIDMIIFCGIDRDWKEPSTACRIQYLLGATKASCMDISNACLGFMNGLATADAYIASGAADNVLVCTGETQYKVTSYAIRELKKSRDSDLFKRSIGSLTVGDAGGAMVVQRSPGDCGFGRFRFWTEGDKAELCYIKEEDGKLIGQMLMSEISREITDFHRRKIGDTYSDSGMSPVDVELLYCHQVGKGPHINMARLADVDCDRAPITYDCFGNLTSATIPVTMHKNRPKKGHKYLILGTGSGLSICQTEMIF